METNLTKQRNNDDVGGSFRLVRQFFDSKERKVPVLLSKLCQIWQICCLQATSAHNTPILGRRESGPHYDTTAIVSDYFAPLNQINGSKSVADVIAVSSSGKEPLYSDKFTVSL